MYGASHRERCACSDGRALRDALAEGGDGLGGFVDVEDQLWAWPLVQLADVVSEPSMQPSV